MLHNLNKRPDRRLRCIYPAPGRIQSPYSTGSTLHYYITGYPMVSHRTPTYFHSRDDTYAHQLESMRIHHADIPATNRTPTISLSSTGSIVMPIVSSHSVSILIHLSKDMNRDQGYYYQLFNFPDRKPAISPHTRNTRIPRPRISHQVNQQRTEKLIGYPTDTLVPHSYAFLSYHTP